MKICQVRGCSGKHKAHGYCERHYRSIWKRGQRPRSEESMSDEKFDQLLDQQMRKNGIPIDHPKEAQRKRRALLATRLRQSKLDRWLEEKKLVDALRVMGQEEDPGEHFLYL